MTQQTIKTEYRGLNEIAERLGRSQDFVRDLILREQDPLPAKQIGREYWLTEVKLQEWLNN